MQDILTSNFLRDLWTAASQWVAANVLTIDTTSQLVVIGLGLVVAIVAARRANVWSSTYAVATPAGRALRFFAPLALPSAWLVIVSIAAAASMQLARQSGLLETTATLLFAWVAIGVIAQFVSNSFWARLFAWATWSIAALSILGILEPTIRLLDSAAVQLGTMRVSAYTLIKSAFALAVLLSIAIYLADVVEARIRTSRALSPTAQVLFTKALKIGLIGIALLMTIRSVGIDMTGLAVFGGAVALGVGFGLQKTVGNFISGLILLVDKSIKPGDVIAVSGTYGWVTALGGRYVSVVTRDGVEHLIPNETLISERVENWTHTNSQTRLRVDVGVHYASDLDHVIEVCEAVARDVPRVLHEPAPKCLFVGFGDSALELQVRFWIADAQNGVQNVKSDVLLRIWRRFRELGIEIPYPQRDLHIVSSAVPLHIEGQVAPRGGG